MQNFRVGWLDFSSRHSNVQLVPQRIPLFLSLTKGFFHTLQFSRAPNSKSSGTSGCCGLVRQLPFEAIYHLPMILDHFLQGRSVILFKLTTAERDLVLI